jgi:hypothetical protein
MAVEVNHDSWRLPMFRFFLFMACVMAVNMSVAGEVSPCSNTVPIQIIESGIGGIEIETSADRISDPHFSAFVTGVTKHINSRLAEENLCINGAGSMESMDSAEGGRRSLLQFVHWSLDMNRGYFVPVLPFIGGREPPNCRISSPWIDLAVYWKPVPQIRGIVRWNERQLLTDQAMLDRTENVPLGMAMPLTPGEIGHYVHEIRRQSAAKPVEARVPPDILWLLRSLVGKEYVADAIDPVRFSMYGVTKNSAAGYTKLVLALTDRCFIPSASGRVDIHYSSILDVADPVLFEQYKIKTRALR